MKKYNENLKTYYAHPNLKRDWMQEKKTPGKLRELNLKNSFIDKNVFILFY